MSNRFSARRRFLSFKYAAKGFKLFFGTQANALIHLLGLVVMITLGVWLNVNDTEWLILILTAGIVFIAEMLNTAIEFLTDHVSPDFHEQAGKVKDIAAAAVLFAAIMALIVGGIIFIPKILI